MRREHLLGLPLLVVLLGLVATNSNAGDTDADVEASLKSKGLTKVHSTWVIEDEKPVLESMKEARAVFAAYAQVAELKAEAEQLVVQSKMLDQERTLVQNNLNALNQQISSMPNSGAGGPSRYRRFNQQNAANNPLLAEKSQLNAYMAEVNQTQKMVKSQIPSPKNKSTIDAEASKRKEAFKTTLTDLRGKVDEVTKKYDELAADDSVKKSIDHLKNSTKAKVRLGPSDPFLTLMKELDKAEQLFLGKTPPPSTASTKHKSRAKSKK